MKDKRPKAAPRGVRTKTASRVQGRNVRPRRKGGFVRAIGRIPLVVAIIAGVLAGDVVARAARDDQFEIVATQASALAPAAAKAWMIDSDGDGVGDFANPTSGAIRGEDHYGYGKFGAGRDGGKRVHHGVDYVAKAGAIVRAPIAGEVTRIGYAYKNDAQLRSIELRDGKGQLHARVLYAAPSVMVGQVVAAGDAIGVAQDLSVRYPKGITNHVHVEIADARGAMIDASHLLPSSPQASLAAFAGAGVDPTRS